MPFEKGKSGNPKGRPKQTIEQKREKEKFQTAISDAELKKISNIAKIQQALSTLENSFDTVKNNKAILTKICYCKT